MESLGMDTRRALIPPEPRIWTKKERNKSPAVKNGDLDLFTFI